MTASIKPRKIVGSNGYFRTKPMTIHQASAFARMIDHNPHFTGVEIEVMRGGYSVSYRPKSEKRQAALLQLEQDERNERAAEQGPGFRWYCAGGRWTCINPVTGGRYIVNADRCECPDWVRIQQAGLFCKHQVAGFAAGHFSVDGETVTAPSAPVETAEARRARIARDREELWA